MHFTELDITDSDDVLTTVDSIANTVSISSAADYLGEDSITDEIKNAVHFE